MFYKCLDCGHIFEEGEQKYSGDGWNEPIEAICPVCGGCFDEAKSCECCGSQFLGDELESGFCEDCANKMVDDYSFNHITELYLMASEDEQEVKLNPFIANMFSSCQINEILLNVLISGDKILKVDCRNFIDEDRSWFLEKMKQKRG